MSEYLSNAGVKQLAISETQKYGHMTYFFNGNNSGKFPTETWIAQDLRKADVLALAACYAGVPASTPLRDRSHFFRERR